MSARYNVSRDPFAFSLGAVATLNSFGLVPAIADDLSIIDDGQRFRGRPARPSPMIIALENLLARYFAPGCHGSC